MSVDVNGGFSFCNPITFFCFLFTEDESPSQKLWTDLYRETFLPGMVPRGDPGQGMVCLAPHSHSTASFVPASLSTDRSSGGFFEPVLCQMEGSASMKLECVGCVKLDVREAKPSMLLEKSKLKVKLAEQQVQAARTKPKNKKGKTKANGFLSAFGRNDNYTTSRSLSTTSKQCRPSCQVADGSPYKPTPGWSLLTCFKHFLSTWTIQFCLYFPAFIHVTMAALPGEDRDIND